MVWVSSFLEAKGFFLYFVEKRNLELGVSCFPKLCNILIKTFSFPTNLYFMLVFSSRQPNPTFVQSQGHMPGLQVQALIRVLGHIR